MSTKKRLIEKFNHFLNSYYQDNSGLMKELAHKQNPDLLVIACSDSRIDPAILFDMKPGEIFSVRNVANIVPAFNAETENHSVWAAIEYAIFGLNIKSILVLGHSNCGGVNFLSNLIRENDTGSFYHLPIWVRNAASDEFSSLCHSHAQEHDSGLLEKENIMHSIRNLKACPWIEERLTNKILAINGFRFDIKNGALETVYSSEEN
tara:strand:- start:142 stop:759 length:618 start_codon:yes stop_codon:yes gene_type:complete